MKGVLLVVASLASAVLCRSQGQAVPASCRLVAQAALVELLEEAGLPPVCAALATEDDADTELGVVLAEAVQVGLNRPRNREFRCRSCCHAFLDPVAPRMVYKLQLEAVSWHTSKGS